MTAEALTSLAITYGLVLVRCSGTFMLVPIIGGEFIPARIRGAIGGIFAFALVGIVEPVTTGWSLSLFVFATGELLLGICIGLVLRLLLLSAELAGEVAGMQMGFAFSRIVDPLTKESAAVTSRLLGTMAVLLLLAIDGHHMIIAGLGTSLIDAPPGTVLPRATYAATLIPLLSTVVYTALRIAAPVMVALLLANAALAFLARAAPALNLFILGLGLGVGVGMWILTRSIGPSFSLMVRQLEQLPLYISRVVGA